MNFLSYYNEITIFSQSKSRALNHITVAKNHFIRDLLLKAKSVNLQYFHKGENNDLFLFLHSFMGNYAIQKIFIGDLLH